jgi:SAM-dependent methyltransferase
MDNYEFCARWVLERARGKSLRVLDYGCGAGEIVKELRRRGVEAFGCEVFYEGGDYSKSLAPELPGGVVVRMEGNTIPFDGASFDLVVNNQVMEHVENLDGALAEISRVLRPGGAVLSLFPDGGVWREGHCGIPFLHWFPKRSRLRVHYAAACRAAGLGYHKGDKSVMRWSRDFCDWLDNWTHYRTRREIDAAYDKHFRDVRHIEDYWLQSRLTGLKKAAALLPAPAQRLLVRKLAGLIFVAHKPA